MIESQANDKFLTPSKYDHIENEKAKEACYGALRFFKPTSFMEVQFPCRIFTLEEIHKFVDSMQEYSDRELFLNRTLYSTHEQKLILKHMELCKVVTERICSRCVIPVMTGVRSIDMARLVHFLQNHRKKQTPRVMEIGPGSGGVGALLIQSGFPYVAYEITQSLYIWLHHLLRELGGGDFCDWALLETVPDKWKGSVDLIPWWHMADAYKREPLDVDIIVCDRAMGEMEPNSFNYILRMSTEMLKNSPFGAFIFSHVGFNRHATVESICQRFTDEGYRHYAFQGIESLNVMLHPDSELDLTGYSPDFEIPAIGINENTASQMFKGKEILSIPRHCVPETYFLTDYMRGQTYNWNDIVV